MSDGAAANETASVLLGFWKELLNVDAVSPGDHLLELGGNSLIATMMANRIELTWGFRPTMGTLMTSSFGEMSDLCEASRS